MKYDLIVSIVVYNPVLPILQQTLDSISKSSLKIKVCIADNSHSSLPPESFSCRHTLEYNFTGKNLGYGKAHNHIIFARADQADYFLVLNPDVFFDGALLSILLARLEQDHTVGLCIPQICHPHGDIQLINRRIPRPQDYLISFLSCKLGITSLKTPAYGKYLLGDVDTTRPYICPTTSGCFMLFRSTALIDVGGFDERFFLYVEDTDLSRRVSEKYQTVVFSDLKAFHYWSRGAYKDFKLFLLFVSSLVRYFNKWGWFHDPLRDQLNSKVRQYSTPGLMQKPYSPHELSVLSTAQV